MVPAEGVDGLQVDQGLAHRFAHIAKRPALEPVQLEEMVVTEAATATRAAALTAIPLLGDDGHREAHQGRTSAARVPSVAATGSLHRPR